MTYTPNARIAQEPNTMQYRALNATELKQYVHEHPEFITCPKCEGRAYSDGTENHLGWRVMCCTCNGHGLVTPKEEATTMQTTTTNEITFDCIDNLIHRYERATHGYYFSNNTMKFFSAKTYGPVYRVGDTEIFVDSIRDTWGDQPRQYRVCEWNGSSSSIDTVIEYKTLRSAEKAARRHAEHLANQ